jgi:hypothetical protein
VPEVNITVNTTIQKTVVTEVSPNQVIEVEAIPSTAITTSENVKTVEVGNDLSNYVKDSETGDFLTVAFGNTLYYPLSNPSGFATGIDNASLVSKAEFNSYTGKFIKFSTLLSSGVQSQTIYFPYVLSSPPILNCELINNIDDYIYSFVLNSVNVSGFVISYSDTLSNNGYKLMTNAFLE